MERSGRTDVAEVLALYDRDERRLADEPGMRREEAPGVVRQYDLVGRESAVIYSRLSAGDADAVIRREVEYFASLGHHLEWKLFGHDRPPDLHARLLAQGFTTEEPETILALDLKEAPAALLDPPGADVRRIVDPALLGDAARVREAVWPGAKPWLDDRLRFLLREAPERVHVYVAYAGDLPVSAARIQFPTSGAFAGLWGGATVAEFRGRGLYSALLAVRAQDARARGIRYLTIDASEMSRPIAEKFGFRRITTAQAHVLQQEAADA